MRETARLDRTQSAIAVADSLAGQGVARPCGGTAVMQRSYILRQPRSPCSQYLALTFMTVVGCSRFAIFHASRRQLNRLSREPPSRDLAAYLDDAAVAVYHGDLDVGRVMRAGTFVAQGAAARKLGGRRALLGAP